MLLALIRSTPPRPRTSFGGAATGRALAPSTRAVLALSLLLALACAGSPDADLREMCTIAAEELGVPGTPEERAQRWADRSLDAVRSADLRRAIEAVRHASADMRYELLRAAARDEGVADWDCAPLARLNADACEAELAAMDPDARAHVESITGRPLSCPSPD